MGQTGPPTVLIRAPTLADSARQRIEVHPDPRRLLCGPEPLDKVNPSLLDMLTGLYGPEREALKAELAARGDKAAYGRIRSQCWQRSWGLPGGSVCLDESGGAFLKTLRSEKT